MDDCIKKEDGIFKYPLEWEDETRMNVLLGPFRSKSLDPVAWNSKFNFWMRLIQSYLLHTRATTFSLASLRAAFTRNGKAPVCLETVIEEMKRTRVIVLASDYKDICNFEGSVVSWLVKSLVRSPLEWTVNKIKSPFAAKVDPETVSYVHLDVAKKRSDELYGKLTAQHRGKLIAVREVCNIAEVTEEDVVTVVKPLIGAGKAAATYIAPDLIIKFKKEEKERVIITEADVGVFQLEKNQRLLADNLETLEQDRAKALAQVRTCLTTDRKLMAKTWLRRKKEIEKYIEKRANCLENIQSLLDKLRQAESDSLVLESYKVGVAALKVSLASSGLTEGVADNTMDELQDVLDVTKDVEDALARPLDEGGDIDLDAELAALLAEEDEAPPGDTSGTGASLNRILDHMPTVPDSVNDSLDERLKALAL